MFIFFKLGLYYTNLMKYVFLYYIETYQTVTKHYNLYLRDFLLLHNTLLSSTVFYEYKQ